MAAPASRQAPAAAEYVDPVYEWLDDGDSYLLRLKLPGTVQHTDDDEPGFSRRHLTPAHVHQSGAC